MFSPKFKIFAETAEGETIECFTWTRDEASGLRRAQADAKRFGVEARRFWAIPVAEG